MSKSIVSMITNIISKEVVDEEDNVQQVFYTCISAWSKNPQNIRVLAPSGEGKTWLVNHVVDLFPEENVLKLSHATPKSFNYYSSERIVENGPGNWQDYDTAMKPIEEELKKCKDPERIKELKEGMNYIHKNTYNLVDFTNKILVFLDSQSMELWESIKPNLSHDAKPSFIGIQAVSA